MLLTVPLDEVSTVEYGHHFSDPLDRSYIFGEGQGVKPFLRDCGLIPH